MSIVKIPCEVCGSMIQRELKEVNRSIRLGRRFFCGLSCSAVASNQSKKSTEIILTCPCGQKFKSSTHSKASRHCSRRCASLYSMSEDRRQSQRRGGEVSKGNLISTQEVLKHRESWKYVGLEKILEGRDYEFEYQIDKYVFDLALLDKKILVEFDSPYHRDSKQKIVDATKDQIAKDFGFILIRRPVQQSMIISPETIAGL